MPDLTHDVADIPSPSGTELALEEAKRRIAELVNPNIAHSDWLIAAARGRTFISNAPEREDILFITIKVSEVANLKRRVRALEAALRRIGAPHECGCWPCRGQCRSKEALEITLDEFRDIARAALKDPS